MMKTNAPPQNNGEIHSESYDSKGNYLVLVIPRLPRGATRTPKYHEFLKARFDELDPSWVPGGEWFPVGDGTEVNSLTCLAPIESLTEEQYAKFSTVVIPFRGTYTGFEKPELPTLDWLKRTFPNHAAVAQCHRRVALDKFEIREVGRDR